MATARFASRVLSIERKRALPTIADVVSSDGIGKLPDYNTAEALQRLPGVSVEIDQGEPRYVVQIARHPAELRCWRSRGWPAAA